MPIHDAEGLCFVFFPVLRGYETTYICTAGITMRSAYAPRRLSRRLTQTSGVTNVFREQAWWRRQCLGSLACNSTSGNGSRPKLDERPVAVATTPGVGKTVVTEDRRVPRVLGTMGRRPPLLVVPVREFCSPSAAVSAAASRRHRPLARQHVIQTTALLLPSSRSLTSTTRGSSSAKTEPSPTDPPKKRITKKKANRISAAAAAAAAAAARKIDEQEKRLLKRMRLSGAQEDWETFDAVLEEGLSHPELDTLHFCKEAVERLSKNREWSKALGLLATMRNRDVTPDLDVYKAAIKACGRGRQWKEALNLLLRDMPGDEVAPDVFVYNKVMKASRLSGG